MVEVGELSVLATIDTASLDAGFDRIVDQLKEMQTQTGQLNASTNVTKANMSSLTKSMIGFGVAGVTAMTALAIKSPVLSSSMAKIGLETLKLSNVIGRQMKPIFDEIGQNLIPSITNAFASGKDGMSAFTDTAVTLIASLSDLIQLDFEGLGINLNKLFAGETPLGPGETIESVQKTDPFRETKTLAQRFGFPEPDENGMITVTDQRLGDPTQMLQGAATLFIDTLQWIGNKINGKESDLAIANGVTR